MHHDIVGSSTYDNPWTGSLSCPDGFESEKVWRIEQWEDSKGDKAYIYMCVGKEPAGLIAHGYQLSDNDGCNRENYYSGKTSCPEGYKDKKVGKGNCGDHSSELYVCYNEKQL